MTVTKPSLAWKKGSKPYIQICAPSILIWSFRWPALPFPRFQVSPQGETIRQSGLLRFEDPSMIGGLWTPSCDTHHLSCAEVHEWQLRLVEIGKAASKLINDHAALTKMPGQAMVR